jgi:hypothetical protein
MTATFSPVPSRPGAGRRDPRRRCRPRTTQKPTIVLRLLEIASAPSPAEAEAVQLHDEADETAA